MMLYTILKHYYCNYLRDNFFVCVVMNFHCSLQGLCDFLYSFLSMSHFSSVLMSTKLIFLLIGIILYLQVTFHLFNIMRNKGTYVLFKFLCQYEVIM